jgi:hypothetical protein
MPQGATPSILRWRTSMLCEECVVAIARRPRLASLASIGSVHVDVHVGAVLML